VAGRWDVFRAHAGPDGTCYDMLRLPLEGYQWKPTRMMQTVMIFLQADSRARIEASTSVVLELVSDWDDRDLDFSPSKSATTEEKIEASAHNHVPRGFCQKCHIH
jgi:hypothetical protein